jgi:singapore isolate B (sub-type 7) whole genome shotgun sequence assembly, scaffold_0
LQQKRGRDGNLLFRREEVVLDRTNQQKQQLMIEVEVLRSRWQQLQQESAQLKEE